MTEEQFLLGRIRDLQEQYQLDIRPYVERLVRIRSMELHPRYVFSTLVPPDRDPATRFPLSLEIENGYQES